MSTVISGTERMRTAQPAGRRLPPAGAPSTERRPPPPALSTEVERQDRLDNAEFEKQAAAFAKPTTRRPALIVEAEIAQLRQTYTLGASRLEMLTKVKNIREAVYDESQGEEPLTVVKEADRFKAKEFFEKHGTRLAEEPRKAPDNPLKPKPPEPTAVAAAPASAPAPDPAAGGSTRPQAQEIPGARPGVVAAPPPASLKIEFLSAQGFRCELTLQAPSSNLVLEQGSAAMAKLVQQQAKPAPPPAAVAAKGESSGEAPVCPVHHKRMKKSRKPGAWFCPVKDADTDEYCEEKVVRPA